ncbi:MAG: D-alanine--D-alanine ligase [Rhodospirillales bacterium]|jgi:D-alanine-D-alanine ligase|nr:D-alanine--D-alanine ligase [Rhodospirillales bacterium]
MNKHVAVLMGGWSAEREVSLVSGASCANALREAGYQVTAIDVQRDAGALLTRLFPKPHAVFNALHGRFGEDGCIQGLLNFLDVPYTHSGLMASALAMDKPMAKRIVAAAGVPVVEDRIVSRAELLADDPIARPFVVKPPNEGSSVGIYFMMDGDSRDAFTNSWPFGNEVMVEAYIPGRELTVSVMGDRPLAVTEIVTEREFYDYDAKYADGGSRHILPADIDKKTYDEALHLAGVAFKALGCRGVARADFRFDGTSLYFLEINTQPGMTPTSLVPEQAALAGISFSELCGWMVENAECDS